MGYYLAAIRGGDRAARSLGVPVLRYKLYVLLLSAGIYLDRRVAVCGDGGALSTLKARLGHP